MKVGRQAFQDTSVHSCDMYALAEKVLVFKFLQKFIDVCLLNRIPYSKDVSLGGAILNAVDLGSVPSQKRMSKDQRNTKGYYFQIQIYALRYILSKIYHE